MSILTQENLKEGKIPVLVYISPGENVTVDETPKRINKPNYFMVGNGTMNKHKIYGIDLLRELADSTKAEQFLLLSIKDGITYDNGYSPIVKVVGSTKYEQNMITEGYKSLLARGLVVRVKKSHYMINPNALIPIDYEQAMVDWNQAIEKYTARDS